mmetsp:Transcript_98791/g.282419  ORF Transcript_98791/g.282419 Transcript_98791/m.282419 type:complete len:420 (-) Transcript_98791:926-2185(-)
MSRKIQGGTSTTRSTTTFMQRFRGGETDRLYIYCDPLISASASASVSASASASAKHHAALALIPEPRCLPRYDQENPPYNHRKPFLPSDVAALKFFSQHGFDRNLKPRENQFGVQVSDTPWHTATVHGRVDICRWLAASGADNLLESRDRRGQTPLMEALRRRDEVLGTYLISVGADVAATETNGRTMFEKACSRGSEGFIEAIIDKVPAEHLEIGRPGYDIPQTGNLAHEAEIRAVLERFEDTPMCHASRRGLDRIVKLLILRGVPLLPSSVLRWWKFDVNLRIRPVRAQEKEDLHECMKKVFAWVDAECTLHNTFFGLVIGCGVHGDHGSPPSNRSQLMKLRGDINTDARQRICRALGVRTGVELSRIRRAREALVAVLRDFEEEPADAPPAAGSEEDGATTSAHARLADRLEPVYL